MSKLDQIEYETYNGIAPQNPDGSYQRITPKTKEQIKALFIELIDEAVEETAFSTYTGDFEDVLRDKINQL